MMKNLVIGRGPEEMPKLSKEVYDFLDLNAKDVDFKVDFNDHKTLAIRLNGKKYKNICFDVGVVYIVKDICGLFSVLKNHLGPGGSIWHDGGTINTMLTLSFRDMDIQLSRNGWDKQDQKFKKTAEYISTSGSKCILDEHMEKFISDYYCRTFQVNDFHIIPALPSLSLELPNLYKNRRVEALIDTIEGQRRARAKYELYVRFLNKQRASSWLTEFDIIFHGGLYPLDYETRRNSSTRIGYIQFLLPLEEGSGASSSSSSHVNEDAQLAEDLQIEEAIILSLSLNKCTECNLSFKGAGPS